MIKKLALFSLVAVALTACEEKIDLDDRYVPVPDSGEPARTVLIEEYTGIDCRNCPNGHEVIRGIENFYNTPANLQKGVGVITVGIHIPVFGDPVDAGGFVTPEASALAPNQTSAPAARINRRTDAIESDLWLTEVNNQISRRPSLRISDVKAQVADGEVFVSGNVSADVTITDARLNVWIVEDDIVGWQLLPTGKYDDAYVHHAVYRAALTGVKGSGFEIVRNEQKTFETEKTPVHKNWNTSNLRAVVFIDSDEGGVLNAAQAPVEVVND